MTPPTTMTAPTAMIVSAADIPLRRTSRAVPRRVSSYQTPPAVAMTAPAAAMRVLRLITGPPPRTLPCTSFSSHYGGAGSETHPPPVALDRGRLRHRPLGRQ